MPLPTNIVPGDPNHAGIHNDTNTAVNLINSSYSLMFFTFVVAGTIPINSTRYFSPSNASQYSSEPVAKIQLPKAGKLAIMVAHLTSDQPGDGALTFRVRINGANSTIVATQAAGGGTGTYPADTTHVETVAVNDLINLSITNASTTAVSATIIQVILGYYIPLVSSLP